VARRPAQKTSDTRPCFQAVTRADRYEPVLNENYRKLARHYNTAVIPARPRKPKDKPKVEKAVLVVKRWILMRLRNEVFHTRRLLMR